MRWMRLFLVLTIVGCLASGAAADEPVPAQDAGMKAAFEALSLRMEAQIKKAELLAKAGRFDDAIAAYEDVGRLWDDGLVVVRQLLASRAAAGPRQLPELETEEPFEEVVEDQILEEAELLDEPVGTSRGPAATVESTIHRALQWLRAHQSPNGSWDASGFGAWCDGKANQDAAARPDGSGKALFTPGVSGLALSAFLAAGYTHHGKHPFADTVKKGLHYLRRIQDPEGCFGPRTSPNFIYNHAMATLAVVQAYGMTQSPILRGAAQRALDFSAAARNPYFGWRYGVRPGDNDTSVTHWMLSGVAAAKTFNEQAKTAGRPEPFLIDEGSFTGSLAWVEKMTDPDYGRVGYITRGSGPARAKEVLDRFPSERSEAMTAAGINIRLMAGENPKKSTPIKLGAELVSQLAPLWNVATGDIDMYYWFVGTAAMAKVGGKAWHRWEGKLVRALVPNQRRDTDACGYLGSWDPVGPWGADGGRIYSTALMSMSLSIWLGKSRAGRR